MTFHAQMRPISMKIFILHQNPYDEETTPADTPTDKIGQPGLGNAVLH